MALQILLGSGLLLATAVIHGFFTVALLRVFRGNRLERWTLRSAWTKVLLISGVVLLMFLVAILEAALWAAAYLAVAAVPSFETALYFSTVTLTTLGYGDVVLHGTWRLLAAFQGATGVIIFGWSTAILVSVVQHIAPRGSSPQQPEPGARGT